jgi:hypothetical protein
MDAQSMPCRLPCAVLLAVACAANAQPPASPDDQAIRQVAAEPGEGRFPQPSPRSVPLAESVAVPTPPDQPQWLPRFDLTHLAKNGDRGIGMTDVEGQLEIRLPLFDGLAPVKIVPGAAVRFWDGPTAGRGAPAVPNQLYELSADLSWRLRPAEWLFVDLKVTPGLYTDFKNVGSEAFRPRGHGLAIVALSEELQLVAGVVYTNRLRTLIVPAGGVRYAPSEDTEFRLVFPAPRISHRVFTVGQTKYFAYLAGEFGGGTWGVRREDGRDDTLGYNDLRLLAGMEAETLDGPRWRAEVGYVFSRSVEFASNQPQTYHPPDTVLFRVGLSY